MAQAPAHRRRRLEQRRSRHLCRPHAGVGRDDRRAAVRDEPRRQGREPGGRGGEARRGRRHGVQSRRRHAGRRRPAEFRAHGRRRQACASASPASRPARRPFWSTSRATIASSSSRARTATLTPEDVERAGDDLKTCDLISDPARGAARDRLRDDRLRQAARRQDRAQSGARGPRPRHGAGARRELPHAERDRARHPHQAAGRVGSRSRRRGAAASSDRASRRSSSRSARAARSSRRRRARGGSRRSRSRRSTPPAPATPSSAASPATSPPAFPSMRRSPRRPATPPSRSPGAGRRSPLRPRPSSKRSAPSSGERTRRRSRSPSPARGRGLG